MTGNNASSLTDPLPSGGCPPLSHVGAEVRASQPIIIYVTPMDDRNAIPKFGASTKVTIAHNVIKRPVKISRASVLRQECTSLPNILPHRHILSPSLRRSLSVANQRCSSTQSHVAPWPMKAESDVLGQHKSPLLEHPSSRLESNDTSRSSSEVNFTSLSQSSLTSSEDEAVDCQSFAIVTRPPSRNSIAYEIVFKAPSVHCSLTPEPRFGPDHTYSFPRATAEATEEDDDDNWDTDGEFMDSDESDGEEEETNTTPPAPQCKYGVFFTAAKPPLPPSALERIRRYRNYQM